MTEAEMLAHIAALERANRTLLIIMIAAPVLATLLVGAFVLAVCF